MWKVINLPSTLGKYGVLHYFIPCNDAPPRHPEEIQALRGDPEMHGLPRPFGARNDGLRWARTRRAVS